MAGPNFLTTAATRKKRAPRVATEAAMNTGKANWARPEAMVTSL